MTMTFVSLSLFRLISARFVMNRRSKEEETAQLVFLPSQGIDLRTGCRDEDSRNESGEWRHSDEAFLADETVSGKRASLPPSGGKSFRCHQLLSLPLPLPLLLSCGLAATVWVAHERLNLSTDTATKQTHFCCR